jgi:formylglycine-generating enzyme required for sulfatase activity
MKLSKPVAAVAAFGLALGMMATGNAQADTFGSGANAFTIDFVDVGNAGNANDAGAGGGSYFSGYGGVNYDYRMGTYEISQDMITKATNLGMTSVMAGAHTGDEPAADMQWYEAAAFVNWLNTNQGYQAAYNLSFSSSWSMTLWGVSQQASTGVDSGTNPYRHKDAYYFLPSEDEWYKAAYHKGDGVTANYWDYATGSNSIPTAVAGGITAGTAVYNGQADPADITQVGGLSSYGTMGQNGNVWELSESAFDGSNNVSTESRAVRGGSWGSDEFGLRSSFRDFDVDPTIESYDIGFRVASVPGSSAVPEPGQVAASGVLLVGGGLYWLVRRRKGSL